MPNIEFWDLNVGLIVDQLYNRTFILYLMVQIWTFRKKYLMDTEIGSEMISVPSDSESSVKI